MLNYAAYLLTHGLQWPDVALLGQRVILGVFFILARFRVLYDPSRPLEGWFPKSRRDHLIQKIKCDCHYTFPPWWVLASVELLGGATVILGFMTIAAGLALAVVTLFGTLCTWRERVCKQKPADKVDHLSCYLWLPEPIYLLLAANLVLTGPGIYSLDYWLVSFLR